MRRQVIPVEIVPQYSSRVFVYAHISSHVHGAIFDERSLVMLPAASEHPSKICETGEAPIAFILIESVICSFMKLSVASIGSLWHSRLTMRVIHRGLIRVPQHQHELHAAIPGLWRFVIIALFKVERCMVDIVSVWEEQDSPGQYSALQPFPVAVSASPWMASNFERGPLNSFWKVPVVVYVPS